MYESQNDLISIVLPVYNGEKYLGESIDSIINQTYNRWELIIIDDCSTDTTPDIVKEYMTKDQRIAYYRNNCNMKLPKSLNIGFSLTKGSYLTWTSDDNMYYPEAIEKMLKCLKEKKVDLVYAGSDVVDTNGNHLKYFEAIGDTKRTIWAFNCIGACFLYTRKVYDKIGNYNENLFLVEDYDYWLRVCSRFEACGLNEILYFYRTHPKNLTNSARKGQINELCEKMLLNNVSLFGKLDTKQKSCLYSQLYSLKKNSSENNLPNKYIIKMYFYRLLSKNKR